MRGALVLGVVFLAGCGGGGETTASPPPTPTTVLTVTTEETARPDATPTGSPRFTITLTAESHTPKAGRPWSYTVRATRRGGGAAGGSAKMRVFVGNEHVDTLGFFAFDGVLKRTHAWPASLRGKKNVIFQAEVEGDGGTQRANWPVTVG